MCWNRFWILGLGTLFTCTFFIQAKNNPVSDKQDKPIRTIVIDAGHGGEDPGAKGSYSTEKQVTLEVALKLGKILEENMPDVKVVYTRKTDRFDDPRKKAQIANDNKGELFVSIHCNSTGKIRKVTGYKTVYHKKGKKKVAVKQPIYAYYPSNAKGTETYIWATSKNNAKMESLKQNSVIVLDAESEETKQLMDDTDPETFILLNTLRNAYFDQSLRLSTLIEDEFTRVGRISRGARQRNEKGIWVLSATAMPSVLVELGFISNPEEEDYLNSNNGQQELANCIYKAIKRYREELDRFTNNRNTQQSTTKNNGKNNNTTAYLKATSNSKENRSAPASGDRYCVQLLITDKFYKPGASIFRKLHGDINRQPIVMNKKKLNKYIWGRFKTDEQASGALRKARKLGFKDAFVTSC
ncbi:N-acetylmuramoyl-L-alanine amidase family protein [Chitinophaga arvensicola]|uniref:N-acetylmuramoyl-L-alanine amidase n=1 Tax=Chitinophaga arvensicola TaxID=29529 RepID=A0A1I0SAK4_9BACT|nr:N-acetylmuramoyl-L-alanine amidase [Chitinophaga arvensicola]SEW53525.1 N-acetylmuramoyl-L-alanine amidase [Chitinophaga arvensicola]